jgi:hypothetical protein
MANPICPNLTPGAYPFYLGSICLFKLRADLQAIASNNQIFQRLFAGSNYQALNLVAVYHSGVITGATVGFIYDQINQTGNEVGALTFTTITPTLVISNTASFFPGSTFRYANTPILNLNSLSSTPATVDIYIYGYDLTPDP